MKILGPYKGYYGSRDFTFANELGGEAHWFGELLFLDETCGPPLTYRAPFQNDVSSSDIEQSFKNAVDDYLRYCNAVGKSPKTTNEMNILREIKYTGMVIENHQAQLQELQRVLSECQKEKPTSTMEQKSFSPEEKQ